MSESTVEPIDSWDVDIAIEMARDVVERYNARPYGFRFLTRERSEQDLDSHISVTSGMYYLGGKIETREDVEARNDPAEEILRDNMRMNDISRIVVNTNSWRFTAALKDEDVVLDVDMRAWETKPDCEFEA